MAKKSSTILPLEKVHTQTIMGELVPAVVSITRAATRPRPGQPTKRTDAIIDEIIARLEEGEALTMICADPEMPGLRTVNTWKRNDPALQDRFNQAREDGAYVLDDIAELIARKIPGYATGDFRYDDLLVSVLAQRKRYANRKRFGEQVKVDQTVTVTTPVMPDWFFGSVVDGQLSGDDDPTI